MPMGLPWCPWCFDNAEERGDRCEGVGYLQGNVVRCCQCDVTLAPAAWAAAMLWVAERHGYTEEEVELDISAALRMEEGHRCTSP